jgi:hypothetical protein
MSRIYEIPNNKPIAPDSAPLGGPYSSPRFRVKETQRLFALRELHKEGIDVQKEIEKILSGNRAWHRVSNSRRS